MMRCVSRKSFFKSQSGQALPVGLALLMFGTLLTIVLYNTSQMASEKSRLANTADAAVYSGLVWQARVLNFQAYTNRAMVANQVSIAQLVSVTSWTNYGRIAARNVNNTIGWIPFLRPYTQAVEQAMTQVENVVSQVAEVAIPVIDGVNRALSESQRAVYLSTFAVTPLLVREVVEANDPRYSADTVYSIARMGQNLAAWQNFATRYDDTDGLLRKADVINRSKDAFTNDRGWSIGRFYITPVMRIRLIKEGTTRLIHTENSNQFGGGSTNEWEWKGKDNLSLHVETFRCSWSGCRWRNSEVPIGWGAAYVEDDIEPCTTNWWGDEECPRWMSRNRRGEQLSDAEALQINGNYSGVHAYYDLANLSEDNQDPRLRLMVEVEVDEGDVRTSSNVNGIGSPAAPNDTTTRDGFGPGVFWAGDNNASESMASLSSGEVFFERPVYRDDYQLRVNGRVQQEYGNLFNPYWQVRLTQISRTERLAAWLIRSPGLVTGGATGAIGGATTYVQQQLTELQNLQNLQNYTSQQLGQLSQVIAAQEQQIQAQIDAVDQQVQSVQQAIADAGGSATAAQQQQLASLQQQQSQLQSDLSNAAANVEAELQSQLSEVQGQITALQQEMAQSAGSVIQGYQSGIGSAQSLANSLQNAGSGGISDLITDYAGNQLQQELTDALAESAESLVDHYGGDIVDTATDAYNSVADSVEAANQAYIQPLRDQIDAMQQQLADVENSLRAEYQETYDQMQSEINQLAGSIESRVQTLASDIQLQIDNLVAQQAQLTDQAAIDALQQQIDTQTQRLATAPQQLRQQLQAQVDNLVSQQQQLFDNFDSTVAQTRNDLESQIASIQEQINAIESSLQL